MKLSKSWLVCASAALAFVVAGCTDDDEKRITNATEPTTVVDDVSQACEGDACNIKQAEADAKMASCDFAAAYDAINAV